jgi:hypothetical protein
VKAIPYYSLIKYIMVLGFKTIIKPTNTPTEFVEKTLNGRKKHTLRKGNRWKAGRSIQMATGVRTKNYKQFNADRPDLQKCISTQDIKLIINERLPDCKIIVDGKLLSYEEERKLAWNDGFNSVVDFWYWFLGLKQSELPDQIVHWTDLKY